MSSSGGASPGEGAGGQEAPAADGGQAAAAEASAAAVEAAAAAAGAPIPASLLTPGMALSAALGQEAAGAESEQDMGRLQVVNNEDTVNTVRRQSEGQSP